MRKAVYFVMSVMMALSLLVAACGPATAPTTPATRTAPATPATPAAPTAPATPTQEKPQQESVKPSAEGSPKYGGALIVPLSGDITRIDPIQHSVMGATLHLTNQGLWAGDWTKGNAGGYGTRETDWTLTSYDRFAHKAPYLAESWEWIVDEEKAEGTIVYQIRQGVHWGLNPDSEASRLVGGREMTADDVVHSLRRVIADSSAYIYRANPELRVAEINKTGPWEVTVKMPLDRLIVAISRFASSTYIAPPEVIEKYGNMLDWKNSVGTGPFILKDYVTGSNAIMEKNPNYWMMDPIGPGRGNQLPYIDGVRYLIIPDLSTRQAALRTGKIDVMDGFSMEDADQMRRTTPELLELEHAGSRMSGIGMRIDEPPLNDVRVRRALIMATDFEAINQGLYDGRARTFTWPSEYRPGYEPGRLELDDPDTPEIVRELYTYNPEKAKQLLTEAGYPEGFKTSVLISSADTAGIDYFAIIKDMWAKIGIDLGLDVRESGPVSTLKNDYTFKGLTTGGGAGVTMYHTAPHLQGEGQANIFVRPEDPKINRMLDEIRLTAITVGEDEALQLYRELTKYVVEQAYGISRPQFPQSNFWWPWVKNYSGETSVGYFDNSFPQWVWIDRDLKKSLGH